MPRTFDATPTQVDAMLSVWQARGGSIEALTFDAFTALGQRDDLAVLRVPEFIPRDSQLGCSVAGGYRWDPPTLVVTESMSRRRQQFTLLHELGHHLQRTDIGLGTTVVEHRDPEVFEDACCDAFAARILLPDALVDVHISDRGPTAQSAVELFNASNASRAAISVRLAGRLTPAGVVAVLDETGTVTFAAARGGIFPPARGSNQTANPLVKAALDEPDGSKVITRDNAQVWYRSGHSSNRLYGQATWAGDRLFLIMVEYGAPWLSFSPPRDGTAERTAERWDDCEHCGRNFEIKLVCGRCRQPRCPGGHCGCTAKTEMTCVSCFLERHRSQFSPGSGICLECAG